MPTSIHSATTPDLEPWTFTVPLTLKAHSLAEQFRCYQSNPDKGKQVYLNTLAVYAVNNYLQCRGFETDWEQSDSWNSTMQTLMDVADLGVKNYGKLECRPVLPKAKTLYIPPEVWLERIGYIAVQIEESLREATVLGFVDKATKSQLPLIQLRSLSELPGYLNKMRPVVNLSQWLESLFETGWQTVEAILAPNPTDLAFSFRSLPQAYVSRCKLIELGSLEQAVVMMVTVAGKSQKEIDIAVEVQPPKGQTYLLTNLQLMVLNEKGEVVMDIQAGSNNKTIELEFSGQVGDCFGVKVTQGNVSVIENFVV
ncbi:DUF1822 family protein [Scytonema sp. NUACC26]|uniref:DUF1822 family protein n=1 Tax=Scytonema sp. NUACC26 TaxID=3140176 RepID=UPI0038B3F78A